MHRDLTGPDRHRSVLDPPRTRTGPPWPESADPFRPYPTATHQPPSPLHTALGAEKPEADPAILDPTRRTAEPSGRVPGRRQLRRHQLAG
jgi:hypothetical protein